MGSELLPYLLLLFAIILGWLPGQRASLICFLLAGSAGLHYGRLAPVALLWLVAAATMIQLPALLRLAGVQKALCLAGFLATAVALFMHAAPGFNNLIVINNVQLSPGSHPFTMYLNFDKTAVGLFLLLFWVKERQKREFTKKDAATLVICLCAVIAVLFPAAVLSGFIRFDPKFPAETWIWMVNNLFFVCLAEETLFRGFIQKGITEAFGNTRAATISAIGTAAVLFGLAHFDGGPTYVLLATLAGVFYGIAYHRTNRIEASILVHFGLNAVHFFFFNYPAAA
jgi:membrane protease YdiL (CAAX protease family)